MIAALEAMRCKAAWWGQGNVGVGSMKSTTGASAVQSRHCKDLRERGSNLCTGVQRKDGAELPETLPLISFLLQLSICISPGDALNEPLFSTPLSPTLQPAYHSAFNGVGAPEVCGLALLPLKTKIRGPAPCIEGSE